MKKRKYKLKGKLLLWSGDSPWHFLGVPQKEAEEIKKNFGINAGGFGSLKVSAKIGKTSWQTSIFRDNSTKTYILFIKKEVRKKEDLFVGKEIDFQFEIL